MEPLTLTLTLTLGDFIGFVDLEDACVGPLIFDLAVAVIGSCYRSEDNAFDLELFAALMEGYTEVNLLSLLLDFFSFQV